MHTSMERNLLFINPWIYDFTAYDLWSKPLGLLYIASFLRLLGYDVRMIDCLDKHFDNNGKYFQPNIKKYGTGHFRRTIVKKPSSLQHVPRKYARYGISEELFIRQLLEKPAAAVLITSIMTYWYPGVQRAVELVREYLPGVPVILGGIYASIMPDHAAATIKPDYLISGPGELKVARLLAEILNIPPDQSRPPENIDNYPYPAFDLLNHPDYLVIMTSRGCPYDCSFCAQKQISMPYTRRSPQSVVDEFVEHYRRFRLRDFAFYDDALFIAKEQHIQVILENLICKDLPLRLHAPNGLFARYVDGDLAALMKRSQFKTVRLSFETSNELRRKDMYSKVTNEDMIMSVKHLTAAGYKAADLEAYVMMGLPEQDVEEIIASIIFVHNLGLQVRLASFSPIPGTKEFQKAVERELIPADIDPLLTNKSIFPLSNKKLNYESYRKLRTFSLVLNESAKRGLKLFSDKKIGNAVRNVVRQIQ